METGKKAVVIIIIAMMLTAGVGFFLDFDTRTVTKTEYTPIGNMDALMSANSDRTNESEIYNSVYNVTGWSGNMSFQLTESVNLYPWVLAHMEENEGAQYGDNQSPVNLSFTVPYYTIRSNNVDYGVVSYAYAEYYNDVKMNNDFIVRAWHTGSNNFITRYAPSTSTDGTGDESLSTVRYYGGYGQITRLEVTEWGYEGTHSYNMNVGLNGTATSTYSNGVRTNWALLSDLIGSRTFDTAYEYRFYADTTSFSQVFTGLSYKYASGDAHTWCLNGTVSDAFDYLRYNSATQSWSAISSTNQILWTASADDIAFIDNDGTYAGTLRIYHYQQTQYIDPTKYVSINGGEDNLAVWSVYDNVGGGSTTVIPSQVTLLIKNTGNLYIGTEDNSYLSAIPILYNNGVYSVNGMQIGTYIGLRMTISAIDNKITVQGIITDNSVDPNDANTPTYNYTVSEIVYTVPFSTDIPNIYRLKFEGISQFSAYIEQTYVLTDPKQVLWEDISIDIADYFPNDINRLRVLLQGFVRYGDSVTINGNSYTVAEDNSISANGVKFQFNGLAIDCYNGHTYLNQTNGRQSVDLGETTSTAINMAGIWYFSTTASTISTYEAEEKVWTPGWTMDINTTILTFVGVILASLIIMGMRFREEIELVDVIILILTMAIAMSLLVIS